MTEFSPGVDTMFSIHLGCHQPANCKLQKMKDKRFLNLPIYIKKIVKQVTTENIQQ